MAYNVIDYKTWRTMQLPTGNLPLDHALIGLWRWPLFLRKGKPACGEEDDTCISAVSITPSLPRCVLMFDIEPENPSLWARALARDKWPGVQRKWGRNLALMVSQPSGGWAM